ncbi:PREDICTED: uncharacterized protein LOC109160341 isoform X2 [Ipomoea nil]|uniref:uncharacterized protein LOC109160341 isoform X2 n=1 Tax=Ipomoea nil TaxID=35883 RepID=UPI0009017F0B|nr:PREDICTED: uncharacterized protein LOC109160341 isoform X2 [Ipomoea nil]
MVSRQFLRFVFRRRFPRAGGYSGHCKEDECSESSEKFDVVAKYYEDGYVPCNKIKDDENKEKYQDNNHNNSKDKHDKNKELFWEGFQYENMKELRGGSLNVVKENCQNDYVVVVVVDHHDMMNFNKDSRYNNENKLKFYEGFNVKEKYQDDDRNQDKYEKLRPIGRNAFQDLYDNQHNTAPTFTTPTTNGLYPVKVPTRGVNESSRARARVRARWESV